MISRYFSYFYKIEFRLYCKNYWKQLISPFIFCLVLEIYTVIITNPFISSGNRAVYKKGWLFIKLLFILLTLFTVLRIILKTTRLHDKNFSLFESIATSLPEITSSHEKKGIYTQLYIDLACHNNSYDTSYTDLRNVDLRKILEGNMEITLHNVIEAGIEPFCATYCIALVSHLNNSSLPSAYADGDIPYIIVRALITAIANKRCYATVCIHHAKMAVVFGMDQESDYDMVTNILNNTTSILRELFGMEIQSVMSNCITITKLASAYEKCLDMTKKTVLNNGKSENLLYINDEYGSGSSMNSQYLNTIKAIFNIIEAGQYRLIPDIIDNYLDKNVTESASTYSIISSELDGITGILIESLKSKTLPADLISDAELSELRSTDNIEDYKKLVRKLFNISSDTAEIGSTDLADICSDFIDKNYASPDLTLPFICDHFKVSVQHLGRIFKKKYNMTILEKITVARIRASEDMLLTGDIKIADIAARVGYDNVTSFTRNFKKIEGITPSEYKLINQRGA